MNPQTFNLIDRIILQIDASLKLFGKPAPAKRQYPAENITENYLTQAESQHSAKLMRVNHTGEICAQALYQAQQLTSRNQALKQKLKKAQAEEIDHLSWCYQRIEELNGRPSYLNPVWYLGAFTLGAVFGLLGDDWNLGFLAETEKQVTRHLENHLRKVSPDDNKTQAILYQMRLEESSHADTAENAGAKELPWFAKSFMRFGSGIMTKTAYWI